MTMCRALLIAAVIALPSMAMAEDAAPAKPKPEPKVCKSSSTPGSRIVTRTCKSKAVWDEEDRLNTAGNGDYLIPGDRLATSRNINTGTAPR